MTQYANAPTFPSIPVPTEDPKALLETVLTLKRVVEMLTGTDAKSFGGALTERFAPHVFVQQEEPVALHAGDMWLQTGQSWSFNVWDSNDWIKITDVAPAPASVRVYRSIPRFRKQPR